MPSATTLGKAPASRRDLQKEQTRLDLALAAFELARDHGLAQVRVPQIAAAVGVSTRTFNNYFISKEAAIVWPASLRAAQLADRLEDRPPAESLEDALVEAVAGLYGETGPVGLPAGWQDEFRVLVAAEPALQGEYLKAASAAEGALARAIAGRTGTAVNALYSLVTASVTVAAERAAVLHWVRQDNAPASLADVVRDAVRMALRGLTGPDSTVTAAR